LLLQPLHPSTPIPSSIKPSGHSSPSITLIHPSVQSSPLLTHLVVSTSPTANPSITPIHKSIYTSITFIHPSIHACIQPSIYHHHSPRCKYQSNCQSFRYVVDGEREGDKLPQLHACMMMMM
jgi:hypothetical protein